MGKKRINPHKIRQKPRKKKNEMSKSASQRWHFKKKVRARYGIFCDRFLYHRICGLIQSGCSTVLVKQSNSRVLHKLLLPKKILNHAQTNLKVPLDGNDVRIYVIYDKLRGELNTALPWYATDKEMLADYHANHKYIRG